MAASALALNLPSATAAPPGTPPPAPPAVGQGLDKQDRELLAQAEADDEPRVTMLVAAEDGATGAVAQRLRALGGRVEAREAEVDYLRVSVPTARAERAAKAAGVEAVDLSQEIPLEDPRPEGTQPASNQPAPGAGTPKVNPYMPIGETNAAQLTARNPEWDGRDTVIGIVDSGVDLDHPSLQETTTGERKIIDVKTHTDPATDNDPTWVEMTGSASGTRFFYEGETYTAPTSGPFRLGQLDERDPRFGDPDTANDLNRDGNPAGSSGLFTIAWDESTDEIYVDTDQDLDFTDEQPMRDYTERFDVGHLGADNPNSAVVEEMPFTVQTEGEDWVNIGIVAGAHGTHVAGITAANALFGGEMSGAAPGAKIKSSRVCLFVAGCTSHALIEGMVYLAQNDVDVINMSIGGLPALNDGNNARAVLYNRLIDTYGVQIFISAGNSGPGMNTVGDPSVASKVVSVGSSISRDTWRFNYGSTSEFRDNLHAFSSRGPREDGGFKPTVTAPGAAVSTVPQWMNPTGACLPYSCPPGYAMFNGTSMASPQAAGAAALLVGAAKDRDIDLTPAQLRQAMTSSARFFDRYEAYEQGNGLIDTTAAWREIEGGLSPVEVTSSVEVSTLLSGSLATPGRGEGIHDREGVSVGDSYVREYTFTRFDGPRNAVRYDVEWVGNDGTFDSRESVSLPLAVPMRFRVEVNPTTAGAHSAILNLRERSSGDLMHQTMNTVVAADEFTEGNDYTVTKQGTIGRNQVESHFFAVPEGAPAFKVDLQGGGTTQGAGQIRFLRFHPYGLPFDNTATTSCYNPDAGAGCADGTATSRTLVNPQAGTWEVTVDARRTSDTANAPYRLSAEILGVTVDPAEVVIDSARAGEAVEQEWTFTNEFGAFTGAAQGSTLGSAAQGERTISDGEIQTFPLQVTPGSTSLTATIGNTSDTGADLDIAVFDCTTGSCVLAGQQADGDSEESVTIPDPAAGEWRVVVDGYSVPEGQTTYDYVDVFANPGYGEVELDDTAALRPSGESWTAAGTVTPQQAPGADRVLVGSVDVVTEGGVTAGTGAVTVNAVTAS